MESGSTAHAAPAILTTADGIATITLNRPEVLNALNAAMVSRLHALAVEVETDETIRAVIIKGAGRAFMAGGDIGQFARFLTTDAFGHTESDSALAPGGEAGSGEAGDSNEAAFTDLLEQVNAIVLTLRRMPKPVLAVVEGPAAGFGVSLALACDMVVASDDARFAPAYARIGATPDGGITRHLPMAIGRQAAFELLTLIDGVDAYTARDLGLVNRVVPADSVEDASGQLARQLADLPTAAVGRTKALLDGATDEPLATRLIHEARAFVETTRTDDFREGVQAFAEKRKPRFTGR